MRTPLQRVNLKLNLNRIGRALFDFTVRIVGELDKGKAVKFSSSKGICAVKTLESKLR